MRCYKTSAAGDALQPTIARAREQAGHAVKPHPNLRAVPRAYPMEGSVYPLGTPAGGRLYRVLRSSALRVVLVPATEEEQLRLMQAVQTAERAMQVAVLLGHIAAAAVLRVRRPWHWSLTGRFYKHVAAWLTQEENA